MLECEANKIHITTVRLKSEYKKEFVNWQTKLNAIIAGFPGFLSLEIQSLSDVWTIIQRFSSEEAYQAWRDSSQYKELFSELTSILQNDTNAISEVDSKHDKKTESFVTEVFVTKVNQDKVQAYRDWLGKIHQAEAGFPGFRGMYVQSPTNGSDNWITFLQFDTPENLDNWLRSKERQEILAEAKPMIASLESHRMYSPFSGWFGSLERKGVIPPLWKQTMLVLLVLFPIVMFEMWYLSPLTSGMHQSIAMFIGNAISVSLISWPMMPIAIWFLSWWLATKDARTTVLGLLLVLGLYLAEILFFYYF